MTRSLQELSPAQQRLIMKETPLETALTELGITRPENLSELTDFNGLMDRIFDICGEHGDHPIPKRYLEICEIFDLCPTSKKDWRACFPD